MEGMFPKLSAELVNVFGLNLYQTVITSSISLILFAIFVGLYRYFKNKNEENFFVLLVEGFVEGVLNFFKDLFGNIPSSAKVYILFLFFYILWNNIVGVIGDMFAYVWPSLHHIFRPVTSDILFNGILAVIGVSWAIVYGVKVHGWHFFERYIPYKGMGLSEGVKGKFYFIIKFFDVFMALFIGLLEFIGEFAKMLSLTLRLFGNILAGMVLLGLIIAASMFLSEILVGKGIPFLLPIIMFVFELFVGFLQALVFSLLVLVYFKLAEASH